MIFKATLMRRMKTSELNGRRLIELPTKTTLLTKLDFMPEEREVYDVVSINMPDPEDKLIMKTGRESGSGKVQSVPTVQFCSQVRRAPYVDGLC